MLGHRLAVGVGVRPSGTSSAQIAKKIMRHEGAGAARQFVVLLCRSISQLPLLVGMSASSWGGRDSWHERFQGKTCLFLPACRDEQVFSLGFRV